MSKQYQEQKKKWFEQGKKQATSDILEKIEKVLNDRINFYYDKEDWEQTYLPLIREIEIIKQKIQGVGK